MTNKKLILLLGIILMINITSAAQIFFDGFESGSLNGWNLSRISSANDWTASTTNPFQGTYHAESWPRYTTEPASALERTISTAGYQNIVFNYSRRLIGLDAADEFKAKWFDGTSWTILEQTAGSSANDATYLSRQFALPSIADNNANFKIIFECTAGATSEYCRVDNINISGNLISDDIYPIFSNYWDDNASLSGAGTGHFNVSALNTNGSVLLQINNVNYTSTNLTNNIYNVSVSFTSSGTYQYKWISWGNGSLNNFNMSSVRIYTVNATTADNEYPIFTNPLETPNEPATYSPSASYIFNITITSTNGTAGIEFNGINYSLTNLSNNFAKIFTGLGAGTYNYYYWAYGNGTDKNYNNSATYNYTINRNNTNTLSLTATTPITYGTATDFSGSGCPSQLTCSLNIGNDVYGAGTINANYSTNGNENYSAMSVTFGVIINKATSQVILAATPSLPITYGTASNFSCLNSSNLETILYVNGVNSSNENGLNVARAAGDYNVNCTLPGNENYTGSSQQLSYFIAKALGNIVLLINGTAENQTAVYLTQTNASTSTLYGTIDLYRDGLNIIDENNKFITLGSGDHNYTAVSSGNENYSSATTTRWVHITKSFPSVNYLLNGQSNITIQYPQQVNASGYVNAGTLAIYRDGIAINNGQNYTLAAGYYRFDFNVTGNQNYTNISYSLFANVTKANPNVQLRLNGNRDNLTLGYGNQINASASSGVLGVVLYRDGIDVTSENSLYKTLGAGYYNYTAYYTENQNYSSGTETFLINITKAEQFALLNINESSPIVYGRYINATCNGELFRNNINVTIEIAKPALLGAGEYNYSCKLYESQNYTYDNDNLTFVINKSIPILTFFANGETSNLTLTYPEQVNISAKSDYGTIGLDKDGINYLINNGVNVSLPAGSYIFRANITGNQNYSDAAYSYYNITINKSAGNINLLLNGIDNNITIQYPQQVVASASTLYGILSVYRNGTLINNGQNYSLSAGYYNYTAVSSGNENYSSASITYWLNVTKAPVYLNLSAAPLINLIYPSEINVNGTGCAETLNCTLYRNGIIASNPETIVLPAGNHSYTYSTDGNENYSSSSATINFNIEKSAGIVKTFLNNSHENITITLNSNIMLNGTLVNGTGEIQLYKNGELINTGISNVSNLTLFDNMGIFNITTLYSGNENYSSASDSLFVNVVDTNTPSISIIYPINNSYSLVIDSLNYTLSDNNLQSCWYSINNGITNITITCGDNITGLTSNEGSNTWSIWANDSAGNVNMSEITFFVDSQLPIISYSHPTEINGSVLARNYIIINVSAYDVNLANISVRLYNSTGLINETFSANYSFYVNYSGLSDGIYYFNASAVDLLNNENFTETREIVIDTTGPALTLHSPANADYRDNKILINIISDGQFIWFFNGTGNETYSAPLYRYYPEGMQSIMVYANDSAGNVNSIYASFNVSLGMFITCEAGGPYQKNAIVLVQGNVTNSTQGISLQEVNLSIYKNNIINSTQILTTASDGSFETAFYNLSTGAYLLNGLTIYQGILKNCTGNFAVGSAASLFLTRAATIQNINSSNIDYNVSLRLINNGGSDAVNVSIFDNEYYPYFYEIGNMQPNQVYEISYVKNFTREDITRYAVLAKARAAGIDGYSDSLIYANSSSINVSIPATNVGRQLAITKNIIYLSETNLNITYNISNAVYNVGDEDLSDISFVDSDISNTAFVFNLTKGNSSLFFNVRTISKAASNVQYEFALGTATFDALTFYSNRPKINIPGYGGPADAIVYTPNEVDSSSSFTATIEVKNMNPDIGQDFMVDYWITSDNENIDYSNGQQTIYVSALGATNITANLAAPANSGIYKLKALVSWAGGTASSFDSFEVISPVTLPTQPIQPPSSGGDINPPPMAAQPNKSETITKENKTIEIEKEEIVCNAPYIRHGAECCLDSNENSICDNDEQKNETLPIAAGKPSLFKQITGFFISESGEEKININLFNILLLLLLIVIILLLAWIIKKVWHKIRKKRKASNRLKDIIGLKVYTIEGIEVGKVKGAIIENNKISSLMVKAIKKHRHKARGFNIAYKHVSNIGEIVLVDNWVIDSIG